VSATSLRRAIHRRRRHAATVAIIVALGGLVAIHHVGPATHPGHHDVDLGVVAETCLGVLGAVGAAVIAVAVGLIALGRWRPPLILWPPALTAARRPPQPRARAGPALLAVLCVSRR
jgi:hypothetical protein